MRRADERQRARVALAAEHRDDLGVATGKEKNVILRIIVLIGVVTLLSSAVAFQASPQPAAARLLIKLGDSPAMKTGQGEKMLQQLLESMTDALRGLYPCADILTQDEFDQLVREEKDRQLLLGESAMDQLSGELSRDLLTLTAAPMGNQFAVNAVLLNLKASKATARNVAQVNGSPQSMADFAAQFAASLKGSPGFGKQDCESDAAWSGTLIYERDDKEKTDNQIAGCKKSLDVRNVTERYSIRIPRRGKPSVAWSYMELRTSEEVCDATRICNVGNTTRTQSFSAQKTSSSQYEVIGGGRDDGSGIADISENGGKMSLRLVPGKMEGKLSLEKSVRYEGSQCPADLEPPKPDSVKDKYEINLSRTSADDLPLQPGQRTVRGFRVDSRGGKLSWRLTRTTLPE